jgi:microcystin-dependent protein
MTWKAGMIINFGGNTPPEGWADCNGAAISRTLYPETFAALGTVWGIGDGSTSFNLPDFRGRVIVGVGTGTDLSARALGDIFGAEEVVLAVAEIPTHTHPQRTDTNQPAYIKGGSAPYSYGVEGGANAPTANGRLSTDSTGSGEAHENMMPSGAAHIIIKIEDESEGVSGGVVIDATQWQALISALTSNT